jgi:hypothetical protein
VGFGSPSGGGEEGDLVSSGIARERGKPPAQKAIAKNVNFYQLEGMVSTTHLPRKSHSLFVILSAVIAPRSRAITKSKNP